MDICINFLAPTPTQTTKLLLIFIIISLCNVLIIIRRLFFHPLSAFPGPRLAAATTFYKMYFEVIKGGELLGRIHQLHVLYGGSFFFSSIDVELTGTIQLCHRSGYQDWS